MRLTSSSMDDKSCLYCFDLKPPLIRMNGSLKNLFRAAASLPPVGVVQGG
jgi:hypothetical protein